MYFPEDAAKNASDGLYKVLGERAEQRRWHGWRRPTPIAGTSSLWMQADGRGGNS